MMICNKPTIQKATVFVDNFIAGLSIRRENEKMQVMMVSLFLPLLLMHLIVPVTSTLLSVQVTSYKKLRNEKNGPVMCALDVANQTMSSSSLEDCSLSCMRDDTCTGELAHLWSRDDTCTGFNIKNATTCDVCNYNTRLAAPVTDCVFYQVEYCLNLLLTVTGSSRIYFYTVFSYSYTSCTNCFLQRKIWYPHKYH